MLWCSASFLLFGYACASAGSHSSHLIEAD